MTALNCITYNVAHQRVSKFVKYFVVRLVRATLVVVIDNTVLIYIHRDIIVLEIQQNIQCRVQHITL